MATTDIKILEGRLLTRDSAITGSTVTKCALKMQQLFATLQNPGNKGENASDVAAALESFSRDLLLYKLEMGKFDQSFNMLDEESVEYDSMEANIESNIEETTQSILTLTQELAQQKKIKQHREECEALSRIVNLVPSTRKILASSNLVNEEISRLEEQLASTESVEKLRNRQVNLLLQSIADLTQSLEEEEALQKQLQLLHQSVDNQTQEDEEANEENDEDMDAEDESRDKRSERGKGKRKKPSSGDGDDLEEETVAEGTGNEEGGEGKDSAALDSKLKKQKSSAEEEVEEGEAVEHIAPSTSAVRISGSGSPLAMTVKEKLLQQQVKRAQKKLEKEALLREKEQGQGQQQSQDTSTGTSASASTAETEEGEEEEGSMDTSA